MVHTVLSNENFIGNTVYNRESWPLRERKIKNPPNQWIRIKGSIPPVIDRDVFCRAQRRLTLRWLRLSDDELLSRLKALLERQGRLSEALINSTLGVPSHDVYIARFGSLLNAYRLIGYQPKWGLAWIECKDFYDQMLANIANGVAGLFEARCNSGVPIGP